MRTKVNLYNAWLELERLTEEAVKNPAIKKPIAWALYQVWKWADEHEKPREEVKDGKTNEI